MNKTAFPSVVIDDSKALIIRLIFGNALILFRGLKTRSTRNDRKVFPPESPEKISIRPLSTTMKSRLFQGSLRYEFLWITKPMAITLRTNSSMKM